MKLANKITLNVIYLALSICPMVLPSVAEAGSMLPQAEGWLLKEVATSARQWTGVAVSRTGHIFVNYPRWSDAVTDSVTELLPDGSVQPYPSADWNRYSPQLKPQEQLVCVQSVVIDSDDFLWILDAGNPEFSGVIAGAPKLLKVDLRQNKVIRTFPFEPPVIEQNSYLNDVRIDPGSGTAYLTDSGSGALVVLDLASGKARRVLANHPSTHGEYTALMIEGKPWRQSDGKLPEIHADGIALTPDRQYLYYQALSGRTLYRIPTAALRDSALSTEQLAAKVETVGRSGAADGIEFDKQGNLYLSALEDSAIHRLTTQGKLESVADDPQIAWPDSFAIAPDGSIYFTTSQIHRGSQPGEPYRLLKLSLPPLKGSSH